MKIYLTITVFLFLIIGCSPSDQEIAQAIAQTQEAYTPTPQPTETPTAIPTSTATTVPTKTPLPTDTPEPSCSKQFSPIKAEFDDLIDLWESTNELASVTARIAVSEPVGDLQSVKRDILDLPFPECAELLKNGFENYSELQLEAYFSFMAQDDEIFYAHLFALSELSKSYFDVARESLNAGKDIPEIVHYIVTGQFRDTRADILYTGEDGLLEAKENHAIPFFVAVQMPDERNPRIIVNIRSTRHGIVTCGYLLNGKLESTEVIEPSQDLCETR